MAMKTKAKSIWQKVTASFLAATIAFALVPRVLGNDIVRAEGLHNITVVNGKAYAEESARNEISSASEKQDIYILFDDSAAPSGYYMVWSKCLVNGVENQGIVSGTDLVRVTMPDEDIVVEPVLAPQKSLKVDLSSGDITDHETWRQTYLSLEEAKASGLVTSDHDTYFEKFDLDKDGKYDVEMSNDCVKALDGKNLNGTWILKDIPLAEYSPLIFVFPSTTNTYFISYDANSGTGTKETETVTGGSSYTLPSADTFGAPSDKEFEGWSVAIGEGDYIHKDPGDTITITDNTVVKAVWKDKVPSSSYSIDVNVTTLDTDGTTVISDNGGTASVSAKTADTGTTVTVTATPESGYTLKSITWGDGGTSTDITSTKEFVVEDFDVAVDVVFQKEASSSTGTGTGTSTGTSTDTSTGTGTGTATDTTTGTGTSTGTTDSEAGTAAGTGTGTDTASGTDASTGTAAGIETSTGDAAGTDTTSGATAGTNTYTIIQGADGTWDGKSDYVIEVKSSIDDEHCIDRFKWAAVDGIELKHGENMDLAIGSTIVIIKSDYLKTLSAGTHNIVVNFTDNSVATTLTISAASTTPSGASVPATGEMQSPLMYVGIAMIVAAAGALSVVIIRKRKEA